MFEYSGVVGAVPGDLGCGPRRCRGGCRGLPLQKLHGVLRNSGWRQCSPVVPTGHPLQRSSAGWLGGGGERLEEVLHRDGQDLG